MNLTATMTLNLPSQENKTVLEYSTYERAKWDQYFIATLVNNTNSKTEALTYLDRLTDKGDLNGYFKNLLDEVIFNQERSPEVFQRLLDSSLYPVINLDTSYHWSYIPLFKISLLKRNNKNIAVFQDRLSDNEDKITKNEQVFKDLLGSNETFISVKNSLNDANSLTMNDIYEVELQDNSVKVKLLNNWYLLDLETFSEILKSEEVNLNNFQGKIITEPTGEDWRILDNQIFNDFFKQRNYFYDQEDKNLYLIQDNGLAQIEIYHYSGSLYLYRRIFKEYDTENALKTIDFLLETKQINEVKTKMLLLLLRLVDDKLAHKAINEILANKDSKELAEYGLKLIENGLTSGWNQVVLKKIKQATPPNKILLIYKIDPSIFDFENESSLIMGLPDSILNQEHRAGKELYSNNQKKLRRDINLMIGEITNSGAREKMKVLKSTDTVKRFKKFLNEYVGHNQKNYETMTLKALEKEYKVIQYVYNNDYLQIMKMIEKENSKNKGGK